MGWGSEKLIDMQDTGTVPEDPSDPPEDPEEERDQLEGVLATGYTAWMGLGAALGYLGPERPARRAWDRLHARVKELAAAGGSTDLWGDVVDLGVSLGFHEPGPDDPPPF